MSSGGDKIFSRRMDKHLKMEYFLRIAADF